MKAIPFLVLILFCFICSSCFGFLNFGTRINVDSIYKELLGIRITPVVFPAAILSNGRNIEPYIHMPYTVPYGKFKAMVPSGTIITIHHVIREYGTDASVFDSVWGKIDIPGYSGFVVVGVCDGKKPPELNQCIDLNQYKIIK